MTRTGGTQGKMCGSQGLYVWLLRLLSAAPDTAIVVVADEVAHTAPKRTVRYSRGVERQLPRLLIMVLGSTCGSRVLRAALGSVTMGVAFEPLHTSVSLGYHVRLPIQISAISETVLTFAFIFIKSTISPIISLSTGSSYLSSFVHICPTYIRCSALWPSCTYVCWLEWALINFEWFYALL